MASPLQIAPFVENDTALELPCTYAGADISDAISIKLHIDYKPWPLSVSATSVSFDGDDTTFTFAWRNRVESTLSAALAAGADHLEVQVGDYSSFPTSGELLLEHDESELVEKLRFYSKGSPKTLYLTDAPEYAHAQGAEIFFQPDLRAGKVNAEVEVTFANGKNLTFKNLVLDIGPEIA